MTILSVNGLSLSFGPKDILKDVSFALNENDRLGIVGANGCGKSTLLSRQDRADRRQRFYKPEHHGRTADAGQRV